MLAAATALAAWAWTLEPDGQAAPAKVGVRHFDTAEPPRPLPSPGAPPAARPAGWALAQQPLEPAGFDPFAGVAPVAAGAPPATVAPTPVQPPQVPQAPVPDYRFLGRLSTPDGATITLLLRQQSVLAVAPGQVLEDGFVVERIAPEGVHLHLPQYDTRTVIATPPASAEPLATAGVLK